MIIYNVTCNVEVSVSEDWLQWIKKIHIPAVIQTGCFHTAKIHQVISENENGVTYAIQYSCYNMKNLHKYQSDFALELQKEHQLWYGDHVTTFRTLLDQVHVYSIDQTLS